MVAIVTKARCVVRKTMAQGIAVRCFVHRIAADLAPTPMWIVRVRSQDALATSAVQAEVRLPTAAAAEVTSAAQAVAPALQAAEVQAPQAVAPAQEVLPHRAAVPVPLQEADKA